MGSGFGGPYGGTFPFKRGGDVDGIIQRLLGHEVFALAVEAECFSEVSLAPETVLFCVLESVWCVLWLLDAS